MNDLAASTFLDPASAASPAIEGMGPVPAVYDAQAGELVEGSAAALAEASRRRSMVPLGLWKAARFKKAMLKSMADDDLPSFQEIIGRPGAMKVAIESLVGSGLFWVPLSMLRRFEEPAWFDAFMAAGAGSCMDCQTKLRLCKAAVELAAFDLAGNLYESSHSPARLELERWEGLALRSAHGLPAIFDGGWRETLTVDAGERQDLLSYAVAKGNPGLVERLAAINLAAHRAGSLDSLAALAQAHAFADRCWRSTGMSQYAECAKRVRHCWGQADPAVLEQDAGGGSNEVPQAPAEALLAIQAEMRELRDEVRRLREENGKMSADMERLGKLMDPKKSRLSRWGFGGKAEAEALPVKSHGGLGGVGGRR